MKFLFGIILGGLVSVIALGAAAVLNPLPDGPIATANGTAVPSDGGGETDAPVPEVEPQASAAPAVEPEPEAEPAPAPAPATIGSVPAISAPTPGEGLGDGPQIGETASLGTPGFDTNSGAGSLGGGDSGPARTAAVAPQPTAPSIGTDSGPTVETDSAAVPQVGAVADGGGSADLAEGQALTQFAVPFAAGGDRPLMAIVLIDEGENPALRGGLAALPSPITFGVNADLPDATQVAGQYREAGFEISAIAPGGGPLALRADAGEGQVQATLARIFQLVPGATTLMDPIGGPMPSNRSLSEIVLTSLKITGHGLLTHRGEGLNNVPLIADEVGVPSEVIYRIIDDEVGASNISLALERAVQDAERNGSVIVVGRVRQETVSTIFSWILGEQSDGIEIAPVSAVLQ
ncbi:MAG: divergent polysaccharide deacetylase family protein [Pseudomonadota bacterium]